VELRDYIRVLRKQWVLIALTTALAIAAAIGYTVRATPLYQSSIKLFVSAQERTTDTSSTAYQGGLFSQQRAKSYADLLSGPRVADSVVSSLRLPMTPAQLQSKITAQALPDTVLLTASVTDTNRAQAQRLANEVGVQFAALVEQLERPPTGGPAPIKVEVVENARLPSSPVSPKPTRNVGLALVLGLLLGIGLAVLRETLDTTVKSTQDLQERAGAPVLGVIGFDPEAKTRPLIVQTDPHSGRAEAFRQLRTNLQFVDVDHRPTSIVMTSSVSEEGKTTTTANLAISLSQAGIRVALLEGDLRRPRMAEYLGIEGAVGLTTVLVGRASLDDALQQWGDAGLLVLPSGATPPNPSELLGSQGMADLLRELESRVDLVLIDAPPLLPVTDAAVLSVIASGSLLVVRHGRTRREQVSTAIESLHRVDAHLFGVILNMAPTKGPDAYRYGYGYGYDYRPTSVVAGKVPEQASGTTPDQAAQPVVGDVPPSARQGRSRRAVR
jgi:capsular exopolysaccharide synthesis family protein